MTVLLWGALLITNALNFRSGWNLLWMIAIPFGVARLFDRGFDRGGGVWPLTGLYLLLWTLLAMGGIAQLMGGI
ncbi:MAG TPA: hypothetical protein VEZ48_00625 [Sphingomonadaceae bacterium]|nr:hypothetical protein [Sphingomonadaceae bacterium]